MFLPLVLNFFRKTHQVMEPPDSPIIQRGFAVVEQHIFTGSGGITKVAGDVKPEIHAVHQTGGAAPVPGVVIRPLPRSQSGTPKSSTGSKPYSSQPSRTVPLARMQLIFGL